MRVWSAQGAPSDASADAVARIVAAIATAGFAADTIAQLNRVLAVGSMSVYRLGGERRPVMYLSSSFGLPDTTAECWKAYLSGPHAEDRTLEPPLGARPAILHITADEIPSLMHRQRIYQRFGMLDRLSVVQRLDDGSRLATNLYHHAPQGHFTDRELRVFSGLASGLAAAVERHVALVHPDRADHEGLSVEAVFAHLTVHYPELTRREAEVCARLALGMCYDGIASDLRVSVPTAKTYRNRAFERLGIRYRNELFRLCASVPGRVDAPAARGALSSSRTTAGRRRAS